MFEHLYEGGTKTYDTGLRVRGFEVWARPPHHYRHYTTLFLRHPETFSTEVYQNGEFLGAPAWEIGFTRPDGRRQAVYCTFKSRAEAEEHRERFGAFTARLCCQFEVGYKNGEQWADKTTGRPWGATWERKDEHGFAPFRFDLSESEAAQVLAFREELDAEWTRRSQGWLKREAERTEAIARAAALDGIPASVLNAITGPLECVECGAVFGEPGHVRSHGMGCDRCDA